MQDILIHFEQSASYLSPVVLLGLGIAGTIVGIVLWLGGSFWGRFSVGLVAGMTGSLIGLCFLAPVTALGIGLVIAVLAMIFVRLFTGLTMCILALVIAMTGFQGIVGTESDVEQIEPEIIQRTEDGTMSAQATLFALQDIVRALGKAGAREAWSLSLMRRSYLLGLFVAVGVLCWLIRPMGIALLNATAGTLLLVLGMVLILSFKGVRPISYIAIRETFCVGVAGVMSVVGTLEQLLFCRRAGKRPAEKPAEKS